MCDHVNCDRDIDIDVSTQVKLVDKCLDCGYTQVRIYKLESEKEIPGNGD